jgi:hypothetical protein
VLRVRVVVLGIAAGLLLLAGCQNVEHAWSSKVETLQEAEIKEILLVGPGSEARSEISGMAWCGDDLILLPQYPDRFQKEDVDQVFAIHQDELHAFLFGESQVGIEPVSIPFDTQGVEALLPGFEGFEAIMFNGDVFYVTVEARDAGEMMGYIITGQVLGDCDALVLYSTSVQQLVPQANLDNMSHETLLYFKDQVYAIYEANGVNVNPSPIAHVFDRQLGMRSVIGVENIEYRVTDAADVDAKGEFWAINYFFPGDTALQPANDWMAKKYGVGKSHLREEAVERLIKLRIDEDGINLVDQQPIYLELLEDDSRNWEGIAQFGDGFLLVTDKFPRTILAYVRGK